MLHLVAFSYRDEANRARLSASLDSGDRLVLCEIARDWPAEAPLLAQFEFMQLQGDGASAQLGMWLLEEAQVLYWSASSSEPNH